MVKNEFIHQNETDIRSRLSGVDLDKVYTPDEVIALLQSRELDADIVKFRPVSNITGHVLASCIVSTRELIRNMTANDPS